MGDFRDVVEFVYLLIDLFTIFDTADVETHVFPAIYTKCFFCGL